MNEKIPLWKQYLEIQKEMSKKYGEKTITLYQKGDFFEIYSDTNKGYIKEITDFLGIKLGEKHNDYKMTGFPIHASQKYIDRLLEKDYIIPIVEQKETDKGIIREITKILRNTNKEIFTDIEDITSIENKYIMSISIGEEKSIHNIKTIFIGIAIIDINTGDNFLYEFNSQKFNILDEFNRFINKYNIIEIIIDNKDTELINLLKNYNIIEYEINKDIYKLSYQEELLKKIFKNCEVIDIIDYLDLGYKPYILNSYCRLLQYIYEHIFSKLEKIKLPQIYESDKYLILYNDAILQLNIIDKDFKHKGIKCLLDIIDNTITAMGKRELYLQLTNPIIDIKLLNQRYNNIEKMFDNIDIFKKYLTPILDLDKFHRRLKLLKIKPREFAKLNVSYKFTYKILLLYYKHYKDYNDDLEIGFNENIIKNFMEYYNEYKRIFNIDIMMNIDNKINESFFNKGVYEEIDLLEEKINKYKNYLQEQEKYYNSLLENSCKLIINDNIYILSSNITKYKKLILLDNNIRMEKNNKIIYITNDFIDKIKNKLYKYFNKLEKLCKIKYIEILYFFSKYNLDIISKFIGKIDIIVSHAITSKKFNYCKPIIEENNNSFLDAKELRHPIIEYINKDVKFISNDIELGKNKLGMLLRGINSVGKSSIMRMTAISIIMAQIGMYVPAKNFIYKPYKKIFTRIDSNDNLFKKQSSFIREIDDIKSILKNVDKFSLVIGDEISKGTEILSAIAIVASCLIKLHNIGANFIFATHLHQLENLELIKNLKNIKFFHMKVIFNNNEIIYERKLEEGNTEKLYGLEIAQFILNDKDFNENAFKIRKELLNEPEYILNTKTSRYNKNIYMHECHICKKTYKEINLHSHHIIFQKEFNKNDFIKNNENNLVILCENCHHNVHQNKIKINGWIKVNELIKLDYSIIDK